MSPVAAEPRSGTWLAIDTATPVGSVGVGGDGLSAELTLRIQSTHSERLLDAVEYVLDATGTSAAEVTDLVVGSGPGSFTGVRIAAAIAKGWVAARGARLYAFPSLLAVAAGAAATGPLCALFDARRREVYAACYDLEGDAVTEILEPSAWAVEDLMNRLAQRGMRPAFAGSGAWLHREVLRDRFPDSRVLPAYLGHPRAAGLLWLRATAPERGRVREPAGFEPLYVRDWRVGGKTR